MSTSRSIDMCIYCCKDNNYHSTIIIYYFTQISDRIIIDMASVITMNTLPQVTVDDESMIKRSEHTITAITISSSLVVVVVFGGQSSTGGLLLDDVLSDTVVLEFGEYTIVMKHSVVHVCMICK